MELDNTIQIKAEQLLLQHFDVFIAVSGYESRCSFLAGKVNLTQIPEKIVLSVDELKNQLFRAENDKIFREKGFRPIDISLRDTSPIDFLLNQICFSSAKNKLDILIDYSGMPKIWYSAIINFFIAHEERLSNVNLWFSYSPWEYNPDLSGSANKHFETIAPQVKPGKPTALILGLGYEKARSEELAKQLNSQATFVFYADPAYDERYVKEVVTNNQSLLKTINGDQIIKYPIFDLNSINCSLTKLCVNLRGSHNIILAPVGPKPFTLMCFLLSARYPDMKLWKVSTSNKSKLYDKKANGELLIYKVIFTSEEVDY